MKNNQVNGLCLMLFEEFILATIDREGKEIFRMKFLDTGKIIRHYDPENLFPEITPSTFLK